MAELLLVPEVAVGVTTVVVSEWLVEVGRDFTTGDAIVALETDKAVVEVEAKTSATLLRTLVEGGSQAEVGSPLALLGAAEDLHSDLDQLLQQLAAVAAGTDDPDESPPRRSVPIEEAESPAPGQDPPPQILETTPVPPTSRGAGARQFISPIARRLLRDAGVSAEGLQGTGPNGRIVRRDVEAVMASSPERQRTDVPERPRAKDAASAGYVDVPHTRLRRAVARRLSASKQEVPHFYVKRSVVMDDLITLRRDLNQHSPVKISVNDCIIRAVAVAHRQVPAVNAIWTEDAMRTFDRVDIAVAVASERGLLAPVVRGVETMNLGTIAGSVRSLVAQADEGTLRQQDLEGGAITVTNLGMFGVDEFVAIINPPQAAILAVGAAMPAARVVGGVVTVVTTLDLVLSVDHRAIDGAVAAAWMAALVGALESPLQLVV